MNWFIGIFRKITEFLVDVSDRIWKSISNRYKKPDGKIADVSTVKKAGKVLLLVLVIGVAYRMITNKNDFSTFDRYATESKPPFEIGKTLGNDANSREFKLATERDLRLIEAPPVDPVNAETRNGEASPSDSLFGLSPGDANKFSCSEAVKKIQRGESLSLSEREFFKSCLDKKFILVPEIASNIYPKIANPTDPLPSNKAKNAVDVVLGNDEKDKVILGIANRGLVSPTGSKDQETSLKILDGTSAFSPISKDKIIEFSKKAKSHEKKIKKSKSKTPEKLAKKPVSLKKVKKSKSVPKQVKKNKISKSVAKK